MTVTIPKGTPPGPTTSAVRGTNQGRTSDTTIAINVVENDPTAIAPTTRVRITTKIGRTSTLVRVDWAAATDPTSPIAGYEVQRSVNGGAVGRHDRHCPRRQRFADYTLAFDTTYRFRVRAVDTGGHWSPWAIAGTSRFHPFDDRNSRVIRSGCLEPRVELVGVRGDRHRVVQVRARRSR